MTFDFNVPALRKANRVFVYFEGKTPRVYYQYLTAPPAWSDKQAYKRGIDSVVSYRGGQYVCVVGSDKEATGKEPGQNEFWSILRPCQAAKLPAPEKNKTYGPGDAVGVDGKGYICIAPGATGAVAQDVSHWQPIRADQPDPRIYTHAVFGAARAAKPNLVPWAHAFGYPLKKAPPGRRNSQDIGKSRAVPNGDGYSRDAGAAGRLPVLLFRVCNGPWGQSCMPYNCGITQAAGIPLTFGRV